MALLHDCFSAVDALYDADQSQALKTLYQRIEVDKDSAFKAHWDGYLTWTAYRPLFFVWTKRKDLFGKIHPRVFSEIIKYF